MTNIKYDPELPFAVQHGDETWARFMVQSEACKYADREGGEVIDTTPKPKIPEDAEFILITSDDNEPMFAQTYGSEWYWHTTGEHITYRDLVEYVGDAEVTVLVRKEES